jgi:predicted GNAT superfamily acetyltransferase
VRESVRNLGVGRALKEHQRAELARRGIRAMMWTFDPLQAKNAHLNLNVLGARVISFEPNMYGRTESPLHNGLQTDRLLVSCETVRHPVRRVYTHQELGAPLLTIEPLADDTLLDRTIGALPRQMRIEVPAEFAQLMRKAPSRAAAWHAAFREQCQWAVRHDYVITGFHRDAVSSRAFYLLTMEGTRA